MDVNVYVNRQRPDNIKTDTRTESGASMDEEKFEILAAQLSPERPIRSNQFLRGRAEVLADVERELRYFHAIPFIYGYRGVGKTSLARTAAQIVTVPDREHVYVACAPGARMLQIFREVAEELLKLVIARKRSLPLRSVEVNISLNPSIKTAFERDSPELPAFQDANAAVRVLRSLDLVLPNAKQTVIVLDELEQLNDDDRSDLAYLIKQIGDQDFNTRFILVGIAENVHELIGAHESVPRYLKEVSLSPLYAQSLIDIVANAAREVNVAVPEHILFRIAIIGNGFPHFAHLMGKALLTEALLLGKSEITSDVYKAGVRRAVDDSLQELRIAYETATQRGGDYFKHLIWALAHSDVIDIRIDEWIGFYRELESRHHWMSVEETKLKYAIGNFKNASYGKIVANTPARYGDVRTRYRYKRFANMLMRGHVRLQAEHEGVILGREPSM